MWQKKVVPESVNIDYPQKPHMGQPYKLVTLLYTGRFNSSGLKGSRISLWYILFRVKKLGMITFELIWMDSNYYSTVLEKRQKKVLMTKKENRKLVWSLCFWQLNETNLLYCKSSSSHSVTWENNIAYGVSKLNKPYLFRKEVPWSELDTKTFKKSSKPTFNPIWIWCQRYVSVRTTAL